jgi:hypothetical protein
LKDLFIRSRPDTLKAAIPWYVRFVTGVYDAWAKRGVHVVLDRESIRPFDEWLANYANEWLRTLKVFFPSFFPTEELLGETRQALIGKREYWKAEARRFVTQQEAFQATQPKRDGGPAPKPDEATLAQPANVANCADRSGASWQAIEISFLSDERVQIRNGANIETRNYGELGFADRRAKRGEPKPNRAWVTFRAMAEQNGIIRDGAKTGAAWRYVEKRVQEIRKVLRNHFSITADPIPFVKGTGYQACFKIGCSPSFHT